MTCPKSAPRPSPSPAERADGQGSKAGGGRGAGGGKRQPPSPLAGCSPAIPELIRAMAIKTSRQKRRTRLPTTLPGAVCLSSRIRTSLTNAAWLGASHGRAPAAVGTGRMVGTRPRHGAGTAARSASAPGRASRTGKFGSLKATAKDLKSNTARQGRGPTAPQEAVSAHHRIFSGEDSEVRLKKGCQESRGTAEGNYTLLQDSAASRKDSERAQLLTLPLEKFHERFKLCVDENHHFQGVKLRSRSLNPIKRRSCRKVTVSRPSLFKLCTPDLPSPGFSPLPAFPEITTFILPRSS